MGRVLMTRQEMFKAVSWIETNWDKLKEMTRESASKELATHLNKAITAHTMCRLINDMGREFPGIIRKKKGINRNRDHIKNIAKELIALTYMVEDLIRSLGHNAKDRVDVAKLDSIIKGKDVE